MSRNLAFRPLSGPVRHVQRASMTLDTIRQREPAAADAIACTLKREGGWANNAADPGGATDRGVSLRFALAEIQADPGEKALFDLDHDGDVDWHDIRAIDDDRAADIYFRCIWQRYGYGRLVPPAVAAKVFDVCVNTGPRRAALILQQALGGLGQDIPCDGDLGPRTISAVTAVNGDALLAAIRARQAAFYVRLVEINPKLAAFATGWANRAAA